LPWAPASSFSIYNLFPSEKQGIVQTSGEILDDKDTAISRFSEFDGVINPGKDTNPATVTGELPGIDQDMAYLDTLKSVAGTDRYSKHQTVIGRCV